MITWVIHIDWGREVKYYYELATMNGSLEASYAAVHSLGMSMRHNACNILLGR